MEKRWPFSWTYLIEEQTQRHDTASCFYYRHGFPGSEPAVIPNLKVRDAVDHYIVGSGCIPEEGMKPELWIDIILPLLQGQRRGGTY